MTNEEAIKELQSYAEHSWVNLNEAFEMAISAIRQQETVTKCNDLFDEDGGEILNDETVTDRHQMTNAQKIRAMSDEELEVFIEQIIPINCDCCVYMKLCRLEYDEETVNYAEKYSCRDGIMKWLQQPAEEDDHA